MRFGILVALAAAAVVFGPSPAAANIMGIDFSGKYIKVAWVAAGSPFQIATNINSKRKTPTAIAFDNGERLFSSDAEGLLTRRPKQVSVGLHSLLGLSANDSRVQSYAQRSLLPLHFQEDGRVYVELKDGDVVHALTAEKAAAQLLSYVRHFTASFASTAVKDAAADAAGLNVLATVESVTAAAVQYGTDRRFNESHVMCVYDMGYTATQVGCFEYTSYKTKSSPHPIGQAKLIGKAWNFEVSGSVFDDVMYELLLAKAQDTFGAEILESTRALAKLRKNAEKIKETLSANKEMPLYIESLLPEQDFKAMLTRQEFEAAIAAKGVWEKVTQPLMEAIAVSNRTLSDVDVVEIVGGAWRVPHVKQLLSETLSAAKPDLALSVHLNGDEAMALGSAFVGANFSTSFKTRKVGIMDASPFATTAVISPLDQTEGTESSSGVNERTMTVVESYAPIKLSKKHVEKRSIKLAASQATDCLLQLSSLPQQLDDTFAVTGVDEARGKHQNVTGVALKLHLQRQLSGVVSLTSASAEVTYQKAVVEAVPTSNATVTAKEEAAAEPTAEGAADASTEGATEGEPSTERTEDTNAKRETAETEESPSEASADASAAAAEEIMSTPPASDAKVVLRNFTAKHTLTVALQSHGAFIAPLSSAELTELKAELEEYDRADEERRALAAAKNTYEATIYKHRNRVYETDDALLEAVSRDNELDELRDYLEGKEDWLFDEGMNADTNELKQRTNEIESHVSDLWLRVNEHTVRPKELKLLKKYLQNVTATVEEWRTRRPWLTGGSVDTESKGTDESGDEGESKPRLPHPLFTRLMYQLNDTREWLEETEQKQNELTPKDTPVLLSKDMKSRRTQLRQLIKDLKVVPPPLKPTPKPKAKKTKPETSTDSTQEPTNEGTQDASTDTNANEGTQSTPEATNEGTQDPSTPNQNNEGTQEDTTHNEQQSESNPTDEMKGTQSDESADEL